MFRVPRMVQALGDAGVPEADIAPAFLELTDVLVMQI